LSKIVAMLTVLVKSERKKLTGEADQSFYSIILLLSAKNLFSSKDEFNADHKGL
jgi:hypothetical protein